MSKIKLSNNFYLDEFRTNSERIFISINYSQQSNLRLLVANVLQPLRDYLNIPIDITSGVRTIDYNRHIGGVYNSQHLSGKAADFVCSSQEKAYNKIRLSYLFDQLIVYLNEDNFVKFIHVSFDSGRNRRQALVCKYIKGKKVYFNYNEEVEMYIRWQSPVK